MAELYQVTEHVYDDHPDVPGAQILVAAPGQSIPLERARELGLVKPKAAARDTVDDDSDDGDQGDSDKPVVTAETRRSRRPRKARATSDAPGG